MQNYKVGKGYDSISLTSNTNLTIAMPISSLLPTGYFANLLMIPLFLEVFPVFLGFILWLISKNTLIENIKKFIIIMIIISKVEKKLLAVQEMNWGLS